MSLAAPHAPARTLAARARRLARVELDYRFHESFTAPAAAEEILPEPVDAAPAEAWQPPRDMPPHLAQLCRRRLLSPAEERRRFRRMNFAKHRADVLRRQLDPQRPKRALIEEIESLLAIAAGDRNEIVAANVRLAMSVAKKFLGGGRTFDELLSEGIETLLRAAEKFDFARGFRFSTYATTALRHSLHRFVQAGRRERERMLAGNDQALQAIPDSHDADAPEDDRCRQQQRRLMLRLIRRLDARERLILVRRYGLDRDGAGQTLQSLARELGVCKERVRQLEIRACNKLRALSRQAQSELAARPGA